MKHTRKQARSIYLEALRKKKLVRKPCEVCGEIKTDGHHPNYDYPLEIMWLCRKHHREWHKINGFQPFTEEDITFVSVERDTRNKIKVLAAFEAISVPNYLKSLINKAYEVTIHNHQASAKSKKAINS